MIECRRAGVADGTVLGEIHAAAWEQSYAPFFEAYFAARQVASRRTRWHDRVALETPVILVAEWEGRPLALSSFAPSTTRPRMAEILSFYNHPDGWGSGVAAALMAETLRHLRAEGFAQVHLWTLRDTAQSRRFYAKSGFRASGATRSCDFGEGNFLEQVEYERPCR